MSGVVITGPTGAIGMAIIMKCVSEKRPVLAICHRGSKRIGRIPVNPYIKVIEASLEEYQSIGTEALESESYDVFIHLAWNGTFGDSRNDMNLQAKNVEYALQAVELAKRLGCKTFVGAGSQAEYGRVSAPLSPDTPAFPENGYGIAKLAAGNMTRIRCKQLGIKHIWTRILSVYGPYDGDYTMVMSTLSKMINGEETHFTSGEQIWNYLYSEDAAKIMLDLSEKAIDGEVFCLGNIEARPLKDYIGEMYRHTECQARLGIGDIPYTGSQVMCLCVKKSPIDGFQFTSFEKGIQNTINWIKGQKTI